MNWKSALALGAVIVVALLLAETISVKLAAYKLKQAASSAAAGAAAAEA